MASLVIAMLALQLAALHADAIGISFDVKQYERQRVLAAADRYMGEKPITLTALPATRSAGGEHDYYSEADYYWPNPQNPNGPYINRDGQSNPSNFNDHRHALIRLSIQEPALVAAFVVSGERKYADHAIDHLRAWFVDDATKMNPNLQYAQAVRNLNTGRSIGIIDTLHLVEVARSIVVLRDQKALDPADDAAITRWFADYLHWMLTSDHGITEGKAKNNHATCYWLQVAEFAKVTGDNTALDECRKRFKEQLMPQIAEDGSFPQELRRTKPYSYSMFNLDQMCALAHVLSTPQEDLWEWGPPDHPSLHKAVEYMYPFVRDKSTWPKKPDVMFFEYWPVRTMTWLWAAREFNEPKYLDLWKSLPADPTNDEVIRNVPLRQPVLWMD
jgi:hypothetical protein